MEEEKWKEVIKLVSVKNFCVNFTEWLMLTLILSGPWFVRKRKN